MRHVVFLVLVALLDLGGCRAEDAEVSTDDRTAQNVTDVVARVGNRPIGASDVAARMAAEGIDAETALEALIEEELLAQEATRRGLTLDAEGERAVERIMVRAMLSDFERTLTPDAVSIEEVEADFVKHRDKLQVPERRRSWHILVKDSSEAGRRMARSILAEVRTADDPKTVYAKYDQRDAASSDAELTVEELPPITRKANIEKPYKDALFAAESTGPLKKPVETSYGWHVIVLTEIVPGETRSLKDVEGEIRARISQKKRFEKLAETVRAREAEGLVEYDDEAVARLLAMRGLPERSE